MINFVFSLLYLNFVSNTNYSNFTNHTNIFDWGDSGDYSGYFGDDYNLPIVYLQVYRII